MMVTLVKLFAEIKLSSLLQNILFLLISGGIAKKKILTSVSGEKTTEKMHFSNSNSQSLTFSAHKFNIVISVIYCLAKFISQRMNRYDLQK